MPYDSRLHTYSSSDGYVTVEPTLGPIPGHYAQPVHADFGSAIIPVQGGSEGTAGHPVPSYITYVGGVYAGLLMPLQLDASGNLKVTFGGFSFTPYGSPPVNALDVYVVNSSGTVITSPPSHASTNVDEIGGSAIALGQTTKSASVPVVIASDDTVAVSNAGTFAVQEATLDGCISANKVAVTDAALATTNSSLTTIDSDIKGGIVLQTGANTVGKVDILGNAGATLDAAPGATAPTNAIQVAGVDQTGKTRTVYTDSQGDLRIVPGRSIPRIVQKGNATATSTTVSVTLGSNVTAGNTVIILDGADASSSTQTITDSQGNQYTAMGVVGAQSMHSDAASTIINTSGALTVTLTSTLSQALALQVYEVEGIGILEVWNTGSAASQTTFTVNPSIGTTGIINCVNALAFFGVSSGASTALTSPASPTSLVQDANLNPNGTNLKFFGAFSAILGPPIYSSVNGGSATSYSFKAAISTGNVAGTLAIFRPAAMSVEGTVSLRSYATTIGDGQTNTPATPMLSGVNGGQEGNTSSVSISYPLLFNGSTWDRQRTAQLFRTSAALTTTGTVWQPANGKKFRLMKYQIEVTDNAAISGGSPPMAAVFNINLTDGAAVVATVSSWAIATNVVTFTGSASFASGIVTGEPFTPSGLSTGSFMNGVMMVATNTPGSGTTLTASFTHANTSATEAGTLTSTTGLQHDIYIPQSALAAPFGEGYVSSWQDLGPNGYLSLTANNVLTATCSSTLSSGSFRVRAIGTEE